MFMYLPSPDFRRDRAEADGGRLCCSKGHHVPTSMFFTWVTPLVRRGWSTSLTSADLDAARWAMPSTEQLLARYDAGEGGGYKKRVWLMVRRRLAFSGLLFLLYCATQIAQPLLLRQAVIVVQSDDANGLWCAFAIGGCGIVGRWQRRRSSSPTFG